MRGWKSGEAGSVRRRLADIVGAVMEAEEETTPGRAELSAGTRKSI